MSVFGSVFVAMLAALGVALLSLEVFRLFRAKGASFVCLCFDEAFLNETKPDVLIICRTDADQEEIIRRISASEPRKVFIKYI